jgi:cytochrome P450
MSATSPAEALRPDLSLSLFQRLDPEFLANPYPLYARLRQEAPVHWDPYLHAWVLTRYADVVAVMHKFSAERMPRPEQLAALGLAELNPIAEVIVRQMIFMDAPAHTRLRSLCAAAFTPARADALRAHIQQITDRLIDAALPNGWMDVIAELANPLPSIVTAEMMGLPVSDAPKLKQWSTDFSEVLGNFQHNPGRTAVMLETVEAMTSYFRDRIAEQKRHPRAGVLDALIQAEIDGDRLSDEEIVANAIITTVGGQETTTNLIANGLLALLRHPREMSRLRAQPELVPSAVEEFLRFESPIQHTGRLAPEDLELRGRRIRKRQAVIAVFGAANHDPERFPDPERLDISREDNRHLAFGWAAHYCFGAPLARVEGQIAFSTILRKMHNIALETDHLVWRNNIAFRGVEALPVSFDRRQN